MNTVIIIPTIREESIKTFLDTWSFKDCRVVVVEDNPEKTFKISGVEHYCWKDIEEDLKEKHWIISRRTAGIRCYGYWKAFSTGKEEYFITLDDDCLPFSENLIESHIENLEMEDYYGWEKTTSEFTRGYPYDIRKPIKNVGVSHGLWANNPDYDAPHELIYGRRQNVLFYNKFIPRGKFYPMCGMNLAFRREILPLMFFPLMGLNQPYDRFDDIWAGILSKKVMDHLNYRVWSGEPYVDHTRASNKFNNLVKEATGIKENEVLWRAVASVKLTGDTVKGCYIELAEKLEHFNKEYYKELKESMKIWANLF